MQRSFLMQLLAGGLVLARYLQQCSYLPEGLLSVVRLRETLHLQEIRALPHAVRCLQKAWPNAV